MEEVKISGFCWVWIAYADTLQDEKTCRVFSYVLIYVRPQGRSPCGVDFLCHDYLSLSWDFFLCFGWEFCLPSSWSCLSLLRTLCLSGGLCCFSAGFCPFLTVCSHSARSWLRFVAPPTNERFSVYFSEHLILQIPIDKIMNIIFYHNHIYNSILFR